MKDENVLEIKNLKVSFPIHGGLFLRKVAEVKAVDDVSLELKKGETLGLVGESGCGKSTIGKAVINIQRFTSPDVQIEGEVWLKTDTGEVNITNLTNKEMRKYRGMIQMIFQDPYSSLNARLSVGQIIEEPLLYHTDMKKQERSEKSCVAFRESRFATRTIQTLSTRIQRRTTTANRNCQSPRNESQSYYC